MHILVKELHQFSLTMWHVLARNHDSLAVHILPLHITMTTLKMLEFDVHQVRDSLYDHYVKLCQLTLQDFILTYETPCIYSLMSGWRCEANWRPVSKCGTSGSVSQSEMGNCD